MMQRPGKQGLYDPANEHDACGVGFVANIEGIRSHDLVHKGIEVLVHLEHRGACGCDPETGDGSGVLIQLPDRFLRQEAAKLGFKQAAMPPPGQRTERPRGIEPRAIGHTKELVSWLSRPYLDEQILSTSEGSR